MKRFELFGISKKYGKVSLSAHIEAGDDFTPTELQEYTGNHGEEILSTIYLIKIAPPHSENRS